MVSKESGCLQIGMRKQSFKSNRIKPRRLSIDFHQIPQDPFNLIRVINYSHNLYLITVFRANQQRTPSQGDGLPRVLGRNLDFDFIL